MLAIRMQRTGRTGHAQFRLIAQDSRFSPSSGRVVAYLGSYNPHTKEAEIDKELAAEYLSKGAQPSERAAKLLKAEGVKLPSWVAQPEKKKRDIRSPEKLRRNRPAGAPAPEAPAAEETAGEEAPTSEAPAEEAPAAETEAPAEEATAEAPAEEPATEPAAEDKPAEEATPAEAEAETPAEEPAPDAEAEKS